MSDLSYWYPHAKIKRDHELAVWKFEVKGAGAYTKRFYNKSDAVRFARAELSRNRICRLEIYTAKNKICSVQLSRLNKEIQTEQRELRLEILTLQSELKQYKEKLWNLKEIFDEV